MATLTATAQLSKTVFVSRMMAFLRPSTRRYNKQSGSARLSNVLADIQRYARYNEEDGIAYTYGNTAYAVEWSVQSLRLNQEAEQALRAMDVRQLVNLVYDLHKACGVQIEVTYRLNEQF